tara:strand:+ start:384 stop:749 length:366 start_codon:yes stop_codon:yes gene_type:complete
MSIITKINSIPLFTIKAQALSWGKLNGFTGCREQQYFGKKGYIADQVATSALFTEAFVKKATADVTYKNITIVNPTASSTFLDSYGMETLSSSSSVSKPTTSIASSGGAEGDAGGGDSYGG